MQVPWVWKRAISVGPAETIPIPLFPVEVYAMHGDYCCWHPAWGLNSTVLGKDLEIFPNLNDSRILWLMSSPRFQASMITISPQPSVEWVCLHTAPLRIADKYCAYCMTDALPRKHYLFSLFLSPLPALPSIPSCILKCLLFSDIPSLKMRWLVLTVKAWRQQPYYQDMFMGIFSKENHWEQLFHLFVCLFV